MNETKQCEYPLPDELPRLLLDWYDGHKRTLPWRGTSDPYRVFLSEIMLQQTRVEAVRGYYARFLEACPDVYALAQISDERLNKLWEGLGYYSRARNLKRAAVAVVETYGGRFPQDVDELQTLPGIGAYTAGAIASIAFGLPAAAVDGNVLRVVARLNAEETPIDDAGLKKRLTAGLTALYPKGRCGDFTQSFMDFGSIVCTPKNPQCGACPLQKICKAFGRGELERYPVRSPKRARKLEKLTVFALTRSGALAVEKRADTGLLAGLWQLPNARGHLTEAEAGAYLTAHGLKAEGAFTVTNARHIFTHVEWDMRVYTLEVTGDAAFEFVSPERLKQEIPLPTAFRKCIVAQF